MDAALQPQPHRFTVATFHRMARQGYFQPEARAELIDGTVYDMPPIGPEHASLVDSLTECLAVYCAGRYWVRIQNPLRLDDFNELYPDLAVLRRRADRYYRQTPGPQDVLLVVEVSHASRRHDERVKLPLYRRAGIPDIWLIDVAQAGALHYTRAGDGYESRSVTGQDGILEAVGLPGLQVRLGDLLPGV